MSFLSLSSDSGSRPLPALFISVSRLYLAFLDNSPYQYPFCEMVEGTSDLPACGFLMAFQPLVQQHTTFVPTKAAWLRPSLPPHRSDLPSLQHGTLLHVQRPRGRGAGYDLRRKRQGPYDSPSRCLRAEDCGQLVANLARPILTVREYALRIGSAIPPASSPILTGLARRQTRSSCDTSPSAMSGYT